MGVTARPNMKVDEIWQSIIEDCKNKSQKSINVGSALRRKAILEINKRLKD